VEILHQKISKIKNSYKLETSFGCSVFLVSYLKTETQKYTDQYLYKLLYIDASVNVILKQRYVA
jgi:uncharacterized protein YutD